MIFIPQQKGQLWSVVTTYNGLSCLENHLCDSTYFRYNSLSYGFGRHVGIKQNNLFQRKMAKSWTHDYLCGLESAQFCWSGLPTLNPPGCRAPSGTKSSGIPSQRHSWSCIVAALQGKREKEGRNVIINCIIQILYFKIKCMHLTINRTFLLETLRSFGKRSSAGKQMKNNYF